MYDTILVPTDGSETARRAADEAFRLARETGAEVHVVYVVDESATSLLLTDRSLADLHEALNEEGREATAALADRAEGVEVVTDVVRGMSVAETITDYAARNGVDLVVMGTRGRHGVGHVLGSTTERVVERSSIPVLVVSSAGEETGDGDGSGSPESG